MFSVRARFPNISSYWQCLQHGRRSYPSCASTLISPPSTDSLLPLSPCQSCSFPSVLNSGDYVRITIHCIPCHSARVYLCSCAQSMKNKQHSGSRSALRKCTLTDRPLECFSRIYFWSSDKWTTQEMLVQLTDNLPDNLTCLDPVNLALLGLKCQFPSRRRSLSDSQQVKKCLLHQHSSACVR